MSNWHQNCFYRVSLKALIRNEAGDILMVREKGVLGLPGGGWDYGETVHQALQRELREEIGLTSDFDERIIGTAPRWLEHKQAWLLWIVYEISYDSLELSIGEHGEEVVWVAEEDIDMTIASGPMIKHVLAGVDRG